METMMKGIILAGGYGTRLYPLTRTVSKQILPLYDKPMIYYPLSVLMLAGIREVLIISTPRDIPLFKELFGNGAWLGMHFDYVIQESPRGVADAFILGEQFIGNDNCALVLGDNVFYCQGFGETLKKASSKISQEGGGFIFAYYVRDPSDYGVVELSRDGKAVSIQENPVNPKSHYAVPGLYFYDNKVINIAQNLKPSARGEIEITAVNRAYLENDKLLVEILGRDVVWLDTGSYDSLLEASNFITTNQKRQGMYVSCIEEIAYSNGWIGKEDLKKLAASYKTDYGIYLSWIAENT
jgi:glucose-1-phosphate thymidylyltransferase